MVHGRKQDAWRTRKLLTSEQKQDLKVKRELQARHVPKIDREFKYTPVFGKGKITNFLVILLISKDCCRTVKGEDNHIF